MPNQEHGIGTPSRLDYAEIDQRIANVAHDRSYRVLHSLEKSIREIENVIMPEVKKGIVLWKERVNMSSLLVLGFIATLAIFAEIQVGILDFLIDPITGPLILIVVLAIMTPLHLIISKLQAKLIASRLHDRQKELHLMENLANIFEKNLTFLHMVLPLTEPVDWNKKTKARLSQLSDKTKDLVQSLNDNFSSYNEPPSRTHPDFNEYTQGITIQRT
ncbi:MAG: hypothetical protein ACXW0H_00320 [Methylobacter sp.]